MTTDHELHDLLTEVADGPTPSAAGWDDIVRRGHHHRRVTRVRNGIALGGLAAVVALAGFAVTDRGRDDRKGLVVDQPDPTTTNTATPESTIIALDSTRFGPARVQGVFLTVLTVVADPYDPCTLSHPKVTETPDRVTVELVGASISSGSPWARCQAGKLSTWGLIELTDPLGDRELVDQTTGQVVQVLDGALLPFPTVVPEGFDIERWDETGNPGRGDWTFSWWAGDVVLSVTSGPEALDPAYLCDGQPTELEGAPAVLCDEDFAMELRWTRNGRIVQVSIADADSSSPLTYSPDVLFDVASGLEPLGG